MAGVVGVISSFVAWALLWLIAAITNLAFGPSEHKTLYVTAGKTLYRIPVQVSGVAANLK